MNATEAGQLLIILAAVTGREPNAAAAQGWAFALDDVPYEIAQDALRDALRSPDAAYVTPQTIRKHAAPLLRRLAASVRSARLRGYVPPDWPETRPLPPAAAERLRAEFEATNDLGELDPTGPRREIGS